MSIQNLLKPDKKVKVIFVKNAVEYGHAYLKSNEPQEISAEIAAKLLKEKVVKLASREKAKPPRITREVEFLKDGISWGYSYRAGSKGIVNEKHLPKMLAHEVLTLVNGEELSSELEAEYWEEMNQISINALKNSNL